jgi:alpha-beta hydrolase superfamily lysophospholipase
MRSVWLAIFAALLVLAVIGEFPWRRFANSQPVLKWERAARPAVPGRPLFVLVHGFHPTDERFEAMAAVLGAEGDVVRVQYPAHLLSNAVPDDICAALDAQLEAAIRERGYTDVRLVAHSSGALIARRTLVTGWKNRSDWSAHVTRVVLLAGMNRGWSASGIRPLDMPVGKRLSWKAMEWLGQLTGFGGFILDLKAGSPFVANLRLDWMREMRRLAGEQKSIEVVQLLGDIDDVVSQDDNQDLQVMGDTGLYALVRVRGTGHAGIVDLADPELGSYRRDKLLLAATRPFDEVRARNEAQPYPRDEKVSKIVFVLHGIRDLGEWSSEFETEIRAQQGDKVLIVSPRYGYLGMGPFLLPRVRERYVRWFMDEYTETLARYPHVLPADIQFFGHSNGTFLLADALKRYDAMRIDRVVFAGSVVPRDYDWNKALGAGQVQRVRNYVATDDWVVALFPRLFELRPFTLLKNDLGSAGFNGFRRGGTSSEADAGGNALVENVYYVQGQHSAFKQSDGRVKEIVEFLSAPTPSAARLETRKSLAAKLMGFELTVWATWLAIVAVVAYVGVRVTSSAPSPSWVALVIFVVVLVRTLQTV